jgi:K+-sensing histidine kinase KdpD
MSNHGKKPSSQVLAVLDDAAAGAAVLELSSTLARALERDLLVVYVENTRSLVAAALPFTQVLSHAGSQWVPLQSADVEQGFRAHATRLRALAARIAVRHAVSWTLRVMRGSLADAAIDLRDESDLLLLATTPSLKPLGLGPTHRARHRPVVAVVGNGSEAGERALGVATRLAQALAGVLETACADTTAMLMGDVGTLATLARTDVLVLPRAALDAAALATLRCPVLLVG